jgi:hypothetical protein
MKAGFCEVDITPRVGVGLCGFGPFLNRMSIGVRDPLKARAAAFDLNGTQAVIVSCDLIGVSRDIVDAVKAALFRQAGIPAEQVMIHCTHTHSGPNTGGYVGWGNIDEPYLMILPGRIAKACLGALDRLHEVVVSHAAPPCEGVGLNREHDKDAPALNECLKPDWRPAKPELTDTRCQVLACTDAASGRLDGFMAYFGCHPVVCCATTRYIHGDFAGVAMNLLEREHPGAVGLFLQGAQGDVNSCVVHKPEQEAMLALDVIAARFANAVRAGLGQANPLQVDVLRCVSRMKPFASKDLPLSRVKEWLAEQEAIVHADGATDVDSGVRMAVVLVNTLRMLAARMERGEDLIVQTGEVQGIRLGPVAFLGAPFEIMQPIKNEVVAAAKSAIPLVMGLTNGSMGYAPDKAVAARGGYAADTGPVICGRLPYRNIHEQLAAAFLDIDAALNG